MKSPAERIALDLASLRLIIDAQRAIVAELAAMNKRGALAYHITVESAEYKDGRTIPTAITAFSFEPYRYAVEGEYPDREFRAEFAHLHDFTCPGCAADVYEKLAAALANGAEQVNETTLRKFAGQDHDHDRSKH